MTLRLIDEAVAAGARLERACELLGLTIRTVQRWRRDGGGEDKRRGPLSAPHNKLSRREERRILRLLGSPRYRDLSPKQLIPLLADKGIYIASEATLYRVMHKHGLQHHRAPTRPPSQRPRAHQARGPLQVFSWDITYLPSLVRGMYFYLYLVVDIWSRRIMAAEVHETECGEIAATMIEKCLQSAAKGGKKPILHSDNGAPMRSATLAVKLRDLSITPSFSRPRVSNDNPFSESLFRTLKYRPSFPRKPFADLAAAQQWVDRFVRWYNTEHLHSAIRFVTPDARHFGHDTAQLAKRRAVYEAARAKHPERWSRSTRNWNPILVVTLNPERENTHSKPQANAA
jgi:putative transposase